MSYLYRRGPGAKRRVMHLAIHNVVTGEALLSPFCGTPGPYNTTINVTLSQPVCRLCQRKVRRR